MPPSAERRLSRPSVEARVQLDRVELLCVPAEPVCGGQRGPVQDGIPVVVAPSRRPDPDVTHMPPQSPAPSAHRVMLEVAYRIHLVFSHNRSPTCPGTAGPETPHRAMSASHRARDGT